MNEPDWILEVRQWLQDRDNAHAAAVSADKDARIKVLESALRAICSEQDARQGYASVETYDAARAASETRMADIVESLCFLPLVHSLPVGVADVTSDAATEITRLRAQVAALEGDAGRWRMFLATRPPNTHAVIKDAIDAALAARKGGGA